MNKINNLTPMVNIVNLSSSTKSMTYEFWIPKCFWTSGKSLHETPPRHVSKRRGVGGIYKKLRNRDE